MQTNQVYDEGCSHCIHNPNATKPYDKMKKFSLGPEVTGEPGKERTEPELLHVPRRTRNSGSKKKKDA